MKNLATACIVVFGITACTGTKNLHSPKETPKETAHLMIPKTACFENIADRDSLYLKIETFPNVVTGILKYNFYEKDDSEGSFDGKAIGNTIYADYTYKSEGKTSVREVAFRVNGNQVTEGSGDMIEKNGKMVFKDRSKINFNSGIKYHMIDCVENDSQFRISN